LESASGDEPLWQSNDVRSQNGRVVGNADNGQTPRQSRQVSLSRRQDDGLPAVELRHHDTADLHVEGIAASILDVKRGAATARRRGRPRDC